MNDDLDWVDELIIDMRYLAGDTTDHRMRGVLQQAADLLDTMVESLRRADRRLVEIRTQ